jgi:phosphate transport system substrate-binding protein
MVTVQATRIGEYRVIASLGRGGMADVFLAARLGPVNFTKLVVIKRLRSDLAQQPEAKRYRALLLDEARLAARMHHPHIVQTFEVNDSGGEPHMTMEFLDGQSLSQVVRAVRRLRGQIPVEMALRVVADVLDALAYAHDLHDFDGSPLAFIHRDVSPQNVFWTYDGEIKLVDFGVAKFAQGSTKTDAGFVKGKITYMAPEQARGEPLDRRADLFACGVVLWELLSGRRLYKANTQAASLQKLLFEPIPDLGQLVPGLDPAVIAICDRALAHHRDQRYPDAATMRADIEDVLESTSPRREQLATFVRGLFVHERQRMTDMIRVALSREDTDIVHVPPPDDESESEGSAVDTESGSEMTATVASRPQRKSRPLPTVVQPPEPGSRAKLVAGLAAAIAGTVAIAAGVAHWRNSRVAAPERPPPAIAPAPAPTPATTAPAPALSLCGSNTIGAELGPALVEAFLKKKGASEVVRHAAGAEETTISGTLAGAPIVIDLKAHGSATAFEGLAAATCDVGMASRAIKDGEVQKVGDLRAPATEHVIALDGIAVIVHPNNPLRSLARDTLHDVFTGKLTDWSQLGGKPGPITVYARDDRSGTYDTFKNLVLGDDKLVTGAKRLEASDGLSDAVATDPSAIGFIGLAYVRSAKALPVGDTGATGMLPTSFTVTTEDYMLSRRLYFYTTPKPRTPLVAELVSFALSPQGQTVVRESGFVDLAIALREPEPCGARCPARFARTIAHAKRVSFDFRFRSGSNDIDSRATRDLDRLVQVMRAQPGAKLVLVGFSDAAGDETANTKLSIDRAQAIARELTMRGITPAVVDGFGEAMPVASNTTETGRQRNRRVEVYLQTP